MRYYGYVNAMSDVRYDSEMPTAKPNAQLVHILIPHDLMSAIEDFRFANRCQNRVEAIKTLVQMGLNAGNGKAEKRGKVSPAK